MALSRSELSSDLDGELSKSSKIYLLKPDYSVNERQSGIKLRSTVILTSEHLRKFSTDQGITLDQALGFSSGSGNDSIAFVQDFVVSPNDIDSVISSTRESLRSNLGLSEREQDEEERVIWELETEGRNGESTYIQMSNPFKRFDYDNES